MVPHISCMAMMMPMIILRELKTRKELDDKVDLLDVQLLLVHFGGFHLDVGKADNNNPKLILI